EGNLDCVRECIDSVEDQRAGLLIICNFFCGHFRKLSFKSCSVALSLLFDDSEDVVLAQDQVLFTVDLDLGAGVLAEQNAVALLHVESTDLTVLLNFTLTYGDDLALDGLLFCGIRDDDPTLGLLFFGYTLHDDAVLQRTNVAHSWFKPP